MIAEGEVYSMAGKSKAESMWEQVAIERGEELERLRAENAELRRQLEFINIRGRAHAMGEEVFKAEFNRIQRERDEALDRVSTLESMFRPLTRVFNVFRADGIAGREGRAELLEAWNDREALQLADGSGENMPQTNDHALLSAMVALVYDPDAHLIALVGDNGYFWGSAEEFREKAYEHGHALAFNGASISDLRSPYLQEFGISVPLQIKAINRLARYLFNKTASEKQHEALEMIFEGLKVRVDPKDHAAAKAALFESAKNTLRAMMNKRIKYKYTIILKKRNVGRPRKMKRIVNEL